MNFKGLYGKAKSELKDLGEGDKDLLDTMESDESLGAANMDDGEREYVRGEDMLADMERDIEISRNRRRDKADDAEDVLDDLDYL